MSPTQIEEAEPSPATAEASSNLNSNPGQKQNSNQLENIKVAVRLRPFTEREKQRGSQRIVDIEQNTIALYSPRHSDPASAKKFTFDYSYWSHDGFKRDSSGVNVPDEEHVNGKKYVGQAQVFEDLGSFLLENALSGYNSALLAYGQTGSGKSYTVSGYGKNEGILPRFARALFEELDKRAKVLQRRPSNDSDSTSGLAKVTNQSPKGEAGNPAAGGATKGQPQAAVGVVNEGEEDNNNNRYEVCFSMIEIYNEVVRDLLAKNHGLLLASQQAIRRGLKVREHPKRGFFVENLTSYPCANKDEIERLIEEGHLNKSIAATSMNETSSRGHTIYEFKIKLYRLKTKDDPEETLTTSVVQLVDLAGSERMAVHVTGGNGGDTFVGSRSESPFSAAASGNGGTGDGGSSARAKEVPSLASTRFTRSSRSGVRVPTSASSTSSTLVQQQQQQSTAVNQRSRVNSHMSLYNHQQQRFKESVSINQSLSALGNCIQVLSQYCQQLECNQTMKKGRPKIPYRDSVLTKLLNTCCLSGNSKVVIIATMSPADTNYDDTLSTLRFADRAKRIRTHAVVNRMSRGQIVDALQRENERLKQMIDGRVTRSDDSSQTSNFDDTENMLENFHGPRVSGGNRKSGGVSSVLKSKNNTAPNENIDATATPTRGRATKRSKDGEAESLRGGASRKKVPANNKLSSATSNPSLSTSGLSAQDRKMQRLVSPASKLLADTKLAGKASGAARLPKSRSMAYGLAARKNGEEEDEDQLDNVGLLDERELRDIKEGILSSGESDDEEEGDEEDGDDDETADGLFSTIDIDEMNDEDKIGLFNKMLSNSSIATNMANNDNHTNNNNNKQHKNNLGRNNRPKKSMRRVKGQGIQDVSMLGQALKKTNPYLSNLNPDEQLTGKISYIIKQGETIIGKSERCDIVIHGVELRYQHAKLTRSPAPGGEEGGQVVYIEPIISPQTESGEKTNVSLTVNGVQVMNKIKLNHCDRISFGSNSYFVFIDNLNSTSQGDTLANADMVTYEMARNEVVSKLMLEGKNGEMIKEITTYVHRPGTGKHKTRSTVGGGSMGSSPVKSTPTTTSTTNDSSKPLDRKQSLGLTRSTTVKDRDGESASAVALADKQQFQPEGENAEFRKVGKSEVEILEESYRDKLMEDTYEFAMPVAEVNAIAKEMKARVTYGFKILTGEEQLPEQVEYQDFNTSDGSSSQGDTANEPSAGNGPPEAQDKTKIQVDDRVTVLKKLDSLDIPPALFIQVHLEDQNIDFYWSKEKFEARRYRILELYSAFEIEGKSTLASYIINQANYFNEYLFDPFIDDPTTTFILIGHAQITLQPISHLSDIDQSYEVLNFNDEVVGLIQIQAIPCHPEKLPPETSDEPYKVFNEKDLEKELLHEPRKLLGKKLVFQLRIVSCKNIPEKYTNIFCQYTLNRNKPTIRTHLLREESLELESIHSADHHHQNEHTQEQHQPQAQGGEGEAEGEGGGGGGEEEQSQPVKKQADNLADEELAFNYSHFICFDKVDEDILDFLEHGFLTIQVVGQYRLSDQVGSKSPTMVSTIIKSIKKYRYLKLEQAGSYHNSYTGSAYYNSNSADSSKSRRGDQESSSGINNSGASSVASTTATVNLFDQQNDDDDENINGLAQENIIDMILTKRKLDRAENQLHYLKRTINIAEHYNKKHIPVKTVKKLLSSYGHELDSGGLEEMAADGEYSRRYD